MGLKLGVLMKFTMACGVLMVKKGGMGSTTENAKSAKGKRD